MSYSHKKCLKVQYTENVRKNLSNLPIIGGAHLQYGLHVELVFFITLSHRRYLICVIWNSKSVQLILFKLCTVFIYILKMFTCYYTPTNKDWGYKGITSIVLNIFNSFLPLSNLFDHHCNLHKINKTNIVSGPASLQNIPAMYAFFYTDICLNTKSGQTDRGRKLLKMFKTQFTSSFNWSLMLQWVSDTQSKLNLHVFIIDRCFRLYRLN
jgi:hypothetical protein